MNNKKYELSILHPFKGIFDIFGEGRDLGLDAGRELFSPEFIPAIDLAGKKDRYIVRAELPGLSRGDVKVEIRDNTLIISGEKKTKKEEKENGYYYSERTYGSFYRTMPLSKHVQADKIKAKFKDGVLEIDIPKNREAKTGDREISVE